MFRTKHLFALLVVSVGVVVLIGIWYLIHSSQYDSIPASIPPTTFIHAPNDTYGVVANDDMHRNTSNSFLQRIREALKNEVPTVIESQHIETPSPEVEIVPPPVEPAVEPATPTQTQEYETSEQASTTLPTPSAEAYDASVSTSTENDPVLTE